tara:strand:+ start:363 stop:539 length:177 start_codon:yes stop_codon:yes gene_type:complete
VTKAVSAKLKQQCDDVRKESCVRDTCDQTAMQTMRNEGVIEGLDMMNEAYEEMLEESE